MEMYFKEALNKVMVRHMHYDSNNSIEQLINQVSYVFNDNRVHVTFSEIIKDLLELCIVDINRLNYQLMIDDNSDNIMVFEISIKSNTDLKQNIIYSNIMFHQIEESLKWNSVTIKDLLLLIHSLDYETKKHVLENVLFGDAGNAIFSYYIKGDKIYFR